MFNCGPRPENWPSREVLLDWPTAEVQALANEYWFWGQRCDQQLALVYMYLKCNKGDKDMCKQIESIKERESKASE